MRLSRNEEKNLNDLTLYVIERKTNVYWQNVGSELYDTAVLG